MVLSNLPGIGERLMKRLDDHFGGRHELIKTLESGDISRIAEVEGISIKRALTLAREYNGAETTFLATPEADKLHAQLIASLQKFSSNTASSSRMQMLMPLHQLQERRVRCQSMLDFAIETPEAFAHLRSLFKDLSYTRRPNQRYERVIVSQQEHPEWASYVRILTPSAQETWKDYTVFKSVTWVGRHGPEELPPGWLVLPESGRADVMVPEFTLDWFTNNRKTLKVLLDLMQWKNEGNGDIHPTLKAIFSETDGLEQLASVFAMMSDSGDVEAMEEIRDGLWNMAKRMEEDLNQRISSGMETASLDLTGSDMLAALADAATFQRKLASATEDVITDILEQGRSELSVYLEASGLQAPFDLYASNWPVKLNRSVLDKINDELERRINDSRNDQLLRLATKLADLKPLCENAIQRLVEHDMWYSIASWAMHNNAELPELVHHGIWFEDGRHLFIDGDVQPVNYGLGRAAPKGDQQPIALLTGANSGGKTTLLELVAHITILAHMGLPVPAKHAFVGRVEALHVLAKSSGTQSAGALETTLVDLANVVSNDQPKLILADELEAITEPGAGARIIAGMLRAAQQQSDSSMVLVTHLAPAILDAYGSDDLRIDGIEANGLDEHLELIVDRTPKRNCLARSTPELIVRRLVERSSGDAKNVFSDILSLF
ncbi:MAG: Endonuclease MutS2 [Candidatus Poseidoniaceae archaeon]|nr:MAG: Endonuclease MutS2 [Candidatus Poseidoniaceae archaeon]